jgi:hypothetical protein
LISIKQLQILNISHSSLIFHWIVKCTANKASMFVAAHFFLLIPRHDFCSRDFQSKKKFVNYSKFFIMNVVIVSLADPSLKRKS